MLHLVAVLILLSANALLAVFVNYTAGHFMTAIEQKSLTDFYHYSARLYRCLSCGDTSPCLL
jgi:hypothetical protein